MMLRLRRAMVVNSNRASSSSHRPVEAETL
jgi:hypothetical protein